METTACDVTRLTWGTCCGLSGGKSQLWRVHSIYCYLSCCCGAAVIQGRESHSVLLAPSRQRLRITCRQGEESHSEPTADHFFGLRHYHLFWMSVCPSVLLKFSCLQMSRGKKTLKKWEPKEIFCVDSIEPIFISIDINVCDQFFTDSVSSTFESSVNYNKISWRILPSLMSEGGQWGLLVTASLEATGISCHTLAFGFKPAPLEVTFKAETAGSGEFNL